MTIEADHAWMERMVHEIRQHVPRMLRENTERSDFWRWFCGEAESLFRYARHDGWQTIVLPWSAVSANPAPKSGARLHSELLHDR